MKKTTRIILAFMMTTLFIGLLPTVSWGATSEPVISAEASILIDMKTGAVLYEKNADKVMEPASITKVLTAMLTIQNLNLDDRVTIEKNLNVPGNGMDLTAGEELTVRDLLYGMLVHSSNDAAVALSQLLAQNRQEFNEMAIELAKGYGANNTIVTTPSGLNDVKGNVTTARDLALICTEAMKDSVFRDAVATVKTTIPANNISGERTYVNTNLMLYDTKTKLFVDGVERTPKYEGILGIKTGETSTAGSCVVAAAKREGTQLLVVVLNAPDKISRFADSIALLDYGFQNYYTYEAVKDGMEVAKVPIAGSSHVKVSTVVPGGYFITLPKEASASLVTQKIKLISHLSAPLAKGTKVGTAEFYLAGDKVGQVDIITAEAAEKGGPWTAWGISDLLAYVLMAIIGAALFFLAATMTVRHKRKKVREKRIKLEEARIARQQNEVLENKRKRDWPY